ncbi:aldehyde dehydrogenase family protein [Novosphingobium sp. P6W]|uniref:aldehyde dehydrogenase family protein n=1 Tax=Novosphingobium sp. P6W TaxID=1609758 RepID=UPI000A64625B|nr:aldehyde dehydrogenase family protein [Novosphingobium sp. P6W]
MSLKLLIDGALVDGATTIDVINPATGKSFATSPKADMAQAEKAIAAAKRAFPAWAATPFVDRAKQVGAFAEAIEARKDEFARLLTQEVGKPIVEAGFEVAETVDALKFFASQDLQPKVLRDNGDELIVEQRYPQGVIAAITPWNFPLALLSYKIGAALVAGNTVISKPAPTTPLTTLLLGEIAAEFFPAGVFQTLVDQNELGPLLTSHPDIAHVSFTGSTPTGKRVLASAADTLKRFTLELGGNDAAIVLDDVDVKAMAPKIFFAAFINAGQVCFATKRIYAPRAMVDELAAELARLADAAVVGDGLDEATTIGPIQNKAQYDKVLGFIESAREEGGTFLAGGSAIEGDGYFIRPTIVTGLAHDARLVREEQFGPVLPILPYDTIEEAIGYANEIEYGLGGIIWTSNVERGAEVASKIETGTIWVNRHLVLPKDIPFGGAKQSGIGVQNGMEGIEDFTQRRVLNEKKGA